MRRKPVKANKDRRIFRQTADKTKAVNVHPISTRGGFRL